MNILGLSLLYVVILLLQLTFANLLMLYEIKPDFILIFVVAISLRYGRLWGGVAGFLTGLIEDGFMTILFGLNALCKAFVGFFVSVIPRRFTGTRAADAGLLLFIVALVHDFIFNWFYSLGSGTGALFILIRYALPGALYTTLIAMILQAIVPAVFWMTYEAR